MSTTSVNAFVLPEGQGEHLRIGPATIVLRATGETTGGALTLFEEKAPLLDTPTHVPRPRGRGVLRRRGRP